MTRGCRHERRGPPKVTGVKHVWFLHIVTFGEGPTPQPLAPKKKTTITCISPNMMHAGAIRKSVGAHGSKKRTLEDAVDRASVTKKTHGR